MYTYILGRLLSSVSYIFFLLFSSYSSRSFFGVVEIRLFYISDYVCVGVSVCVCKPLYVRAKLENDGECRSNLSFTQHGLTSTITKGANDSSNSSFSTKCR